MAEYATLKVPELKKLLAEKSLSQTGNKADLIARLQESDKSAGAEGAKPAEIKEDEITYSDDEATPAAAPPAAEEPVAQAPATTAGETVGDKATEGDAAQTTEETPAAPAESFAMGLSSTAADDEAKRRADRAKRFGLDEEDEDVKKRTERAKRFGIDDKELATGLDAALPERSLKRGRGRTGEAGDAGRPGKRQSLDRRGGGRRGGREGKDGASRGDGASKKTVLDDPTEKAKAEKRAARFAAG